MDGYKHYILTDAQHRIIDGYSDAFPENKKYDQEYTLIAEDAGRQFEFLGMFNPSLFNGSIPLYKFENGEVIQRTQQEVDDDIAQLPPPPKSDSEFLKEARLEVGRLNRVVDSLSADMQLVIDTISI